MNNLEQPNIIIKYSSYTESQKKAITKYRLNHKEKIQELSKKYYENKKNSDPLFLEKKREQSKQYYQKRKLLNQNI